MAIFGSSWKEDSEDEINMFSHWKDDEDDSGPEPNEALKVELNELKSKVNDINEVLIQQSQSYKQLKR